MVGWHHRLDGHEFEQTPEVGDGRETCYLSHEGGALMNGFSALIKETPKSSLALLPCEDTAKTQHL